MSSFFDLVELNSKNYLIILVTKIGARKFSLLFASINI
jgi:hypothetical protein